jgi:hypothetical protein
MSNIADAINMYKTRKRTIPRTLDELTQPDETSGEPYIERIPLDPWNQQYDYKITDERKGQFEIVSGGEDKTIGTEDDIYFPERTSK